MGRKMWGRMEKARLVGWMETGLWRGVGGDGGGMNTLAEEELMKL